jgi:hypothetical protein
MSDGELHKKIKQKLRLDRTSAEINREEFDMATKVVRVQDLGRAGAKFTVQRNEEEINKIKAKLNKKKEEAKSKLFSGEGKRHGPKRIQYNGLTTGQQQNNNQGLNTIH